MRRSRESQRTAPRIARGSWCGWWSGERQRGPERPSWGPRVVDELGRWGEVGSQRAAGGLNASVRATSVFKGLARLR